MKVLITGGAGFIGSHTVDLFLDKGEDVCVVDNMSHAGANHLPKSVRLYTKDICNAADMNKIFAQEKPDVLVHLAAQTSIDKSISNPAEDAEINVIGTINLLEAGRLNGLKRVVYASTAAVYGEPVCLPIQETHEINMISGYGVSKYTGERYLLAYQHLYGIGYCSLRYSNVFGPRQGTVGNGSVIPAFAQTYMKGEAPTIFGNGDAIRDFVYVKDVARANYLALCSNQNGIYNIGTGIPISVNRLVEEFNAAFKRDIIPLYAPPRSGDISTSYMACGKASAMLGWEPQYSFSEGLRETLEYYNEIYG